MARGSWDIVRIFLGAPEAAAEKVGRGWLGWEEGRSGKKLFQGVIIWPWRRRSGLGWCSNKGCGAGKRRVLERQSSCFDSK